MSKERVRNNLNKFTAWSFGSLDLFVLNCVAKPRDSTLNSILFKNAAPLELSPIKLIIFKSYMESQFHE